MRDLGRVSIFSTKGSDISSQTSAQSEAIDELPGIGDTGDYAVAALFGLIFHHPPHIVHQISLHSIIYAILFRSQTWICPGNKPVPLAGVIFIQVPVSVVKSPYHTGEVIRQTVD